MTEWQATLISSAVEVLLAVGSATLTAFLWVKKLETRVAKLEAGGATMRAIEKDLAEHRAEDDQRFEALTEHTTEIKEIVIRTDETVKNIKQDRDRESKTFEKLADSVGTLSRAVAVLDSKIPHRRTE